MGFEEQIHVGSFLACGTSFSVLLEVSYSGRVDTIIRSSSSAAIAGARYLVTAKGPGIALAPTDGCLQALSIDLEPKAGQIFLAKDDRDVHRRLSDEIVRNFPRFKSHDRDAVFANYMSIVVEAFDSFRNYARENEFHPELMKSRFRAFDTMLRTIASVRAIDETSVAVALFDDEDRPIRIGDDKPRYGEDEVFGPFHNIVFSSLESMLLPLYQDAGVDTGPYAPENGLEFMLRRGRIRPLLVSTDGIRPFVAGGRYRETPIRPTDAVPVLDNDLSPTP